MALVNQFQTKFDNAVTLYGTVANDIRKLAPVSANISSQLNEFSNVLATLRNRNSQMLQAIKRVVVKFRQLEVEARRYVELAKSFAQEKHLRGTERVEWGTLLRPRIDTTKL